MRRAFNGVIAASLLAATGITVHGSSHREALAILNEPCADNTDTYAWVSNHTHDKLYLIMDFNPLHEPGQGNQGLRACNGYRYEFHIAKGASLEDDVVYRVEFKNTLTPEDAPSPADPLGGGNELLWQLTGGTETMKVTRISKSGAVVLGTDLPVLPNNHGPQTDRLIYGLGAFKGYDSGDPSSREVGLYDQGFVDTYIHDLVNGGRIIAGQFDDPYQLDEKGIFDLVNLNTNDLGGIPGARRPPGKDVFTGFNLFSIALEVPMKDVFPGGIPHNGALRPTSTDSLLRVWSRILRQKVQTVDASNIITGLKGSGEWVQVGRNALPLFNAGLVGTQRQTLYLHSGPFHDVTNFGADILFPVLVRDAQALGIYDALGVPKSTVDTVLKGPRFDIINVINLGRSPNPNGPNPIPIADGYTGDVITIDAAVESSFPNGRMLGGGAAPNMNQVNVNSVLISLIVAGNPAAGLARGVEVNDKDYLDRFPFLAPAHQGLLQGHGGINVPTVPNIPIP
ncbi:MAG: DUF4331 family protein [Acidobacteriota bacterium]